MDDVKLDARLVRALARLSGIPVGDDAMAERIATGAAAAIAAVRAQQVGSLFEAEPAAFLPELERLAEPERPAEPVVRLAP